MQIRSRTASAALVAATALWPVRAAETGISPAEWLKAQPAPSFRAGHTLPPLTRFGWTLPMDARIELAQRWGYALEFGGYTTDAVVTRALTVPGSDEARLVALVLSDPATYRLCIILSRDEVRDPPPGTWLRNAAGEVIMADGKHRVWSPEAPERVQLAAAEIRAGPLRRLREKVPIAMILNGGEYALSVPGFVAKHCEQDPVVMAAKGNRDWFSYISERKAAMENRIAAAIREAAPDRLLYIFYNTGSEAHRRRYAGWDQWAYGYEWLRTVTDLPSNEHYYKHFNSGWTGAQDMLTLALNARGTQLRHGDRFCYDWLCAGWLDEKPRTEPANPAPTPGPGDAEAPRLGRLDLYAGLLKCLYTAGMLGGNAGYYAYPKGGFAARFPPDQPPHWLRQMTAFAHVHALFSHHDALLRESDLLPGPLMHLWSTDQPAYEFPAGSPGVRVLVRRHSAGAFWLVTAWAADGTSRAVSVSMPDLGQIEVTARPEGSVYRVGLEDGRPAARLLDANGLMPTLPPPSPAGP